MEVQIRGIQSFKKIKNVEITPLMLTTNQSPSPQWPLYTTSPARVYTTSPAKVRNFGSKIRWQARRPHSQNKLLL